MTPSFARLFVLVEEDDFSINDGGIGMIMTLPTRIFAWPTPRHDVSGTISFADGSAEILRWKDGRSIARAPITRTVTQPDNEDLLWLQARTTSAVTDRQGR